MTHFTTEKWIDFVNETATPTEKAEMESHLGQGCKRCMETVSVWQKVHTSAAMEAAYQPPKDVVRLAKAAFATAGMAGETKGAGSRVKLLFDSFLQPAFEGARSAGSGVRQMLYRADPYQIDVQVETKPGSNHLVITGQLLDVSNPEIIARDMPVILSNMRGQVINTVVNEFGEFSGELSNSGDLQMTFAKAGGTPIVISLREALNSMREEKS